MTDDRTRAERKTLYEKVIRVADRQTDGPQLPGTTARVIHNLCIPHRREDTPDGRHVALAIEAAVDNGDLIRWTCDGGTTTRYTPVVPEKLRKLHTYAEDNGARRLANQAFDRYMEVAA